jgi:hypothetical protein
VVENSNSHLLGLEFIFERLQTYKKYPWVILGRNISPFLGKAIKHATFSHMI